MRQWAETISGAARLLPSYTPVAHSEALDGASGCCTATLASCSQEANTSQSSQAREVREDSTCVRSNSRPAQAKASKIPAAVLAGLAVAGIAACILRILPARQARPRGGWSSPDSAEDAALASSDVTWPVATLGANAVPGSECGHKEPGIEYHASWSREVEDVVTVEMCCAECEADPACGAWVWARAGPNICILQGLRDGLAPVKLKRKGVVSGLPGRSLTKHGFLVSLAHQAKPGEGNVSGNAVLERRLPPAPSSRARGKAFRCGGALEVPGLLGNRSVEVVRANVLKPGHEASKVEVQEGGAWLVPNLGSRAYFAESCDTDDYNRMEYTAAKLLGKRLRYTADISGAGCGCRASLRLVPMRQNTLKTMCDDFYCDMSATCGIPCAEVKVQDSNQYAWASAYHADAHSIRAQGVGPHGNWTTGDYSPGSSCVDTSWPFEVAVSFPVNEKGLQAVLVELAQDGRSCSLKLQMGSGDSDGLAALESTLRAGVTPVVSYTASEDAEELLTLDGLGPEGRGPCAQDVPEACPASVSFYSFHVEELLPAGVQEVARDTKGTSIFEEAMYKIHAHDFLEAQHNRSSIRLSPKKMLELGWEQRGHRIFGPGATRYEVTDGHYEWVVVFKDRVNVRAKRSLTAEIIGSKPEGSVIFGHSDGDWVTLEFEPGHVRIGLEGSKFLDQRVVSYTLIDQESCHAAGQHPISNVDVCKVAAYSLGYFASSVQLWNGTEPRPAGCYLSDGELWFSNSPAYGSWLEEEPQAGSKGRRLAAKVVTPLCSSEAYPTTTSTTTTMSSSTKTGTTTTVIPCAADGENCASVACCQTPGKQCYSRDDSYAECKTGCSPGIMKTEDTTPWSCALVGLRAGAAPKPGPPATVCNKIGQDCSTSKCCYNEGMQCFQKNEYWSACNQSCTPGFKDVDGQTWTCKALGPPTPAYNWTVCSWAGDDCSNTHCCNDPGMICFKKDPFFSGCKKECPSGWDCTRLGASVDQRGAQPQAAEGNMAGTSLFCFAVVTPGTYEEPLMNALKEKHLGIFQCDEGDVFHGYKAKFIKSGNWKSVINTDVFLRVWNDVRNDGRFATYDWTVKVDPDAVFFPDRLKHHIIKMKPIANTALYLKNSPTGKSDTSWVFGFLGPIEIFSAGAMQKYFIKQDSCADHTGHESGEDFYMKTCMEAIGVGFMEDITLLSNSKEIDSCSDTWTAAFHPFKGLEPWMDCYKASGGAPLPESADAVTA